MHIVGGVYRELCLKPEWDKMLGSGGRAAKAVALLSRGSTLHCYIDETSRSQFGMFSRYGIDVRCVPRANPIVFAYFHPLSRPHLQPSLDQIRQEPPLKVHSEVVLRFGLIEGNAIVTANKAVYDPQTWQDLPRFQDNGSSADELAIVLNERELSAASGQTDLQTAATRIIQDQGANVVLVKRGAIGATLFSSDGRMWHIPAYRSQRVFKIGTGDIFSAAFTYYWGEAGLDPHEAADRASRAVATYCINAELPIARAHDQSGKAVNGIEDGPILLLGSIDTIGRRYTIEEARFSLRELGQKVICPALGDTLDRRQPKAMLVLADGIDSHSLNLARDYFDKGLPSIVLDEATPPKSDDIHTVGIKTNDFTTALYWAAWATTER